MKHFSKPFQAAGQQWCALCGKRGKLTALRALKHLSCRRLSISHSAKGSITHLGLRLEVYQDDFFVPLFATFSFTAVNSEPSESVTHGTGPTTFVNYCSRQRSDSFNSRLAPRARCHYSMTWCLHPGLERFHFTETKRIKGLNDFMLLSALASPEAGFIDQEATTWSGCISPWTRCTPCWLAPCHHRGPAGILMPAAIRRAYAISAR